MTPSRSRSSSRWISSSPARAAITPRKFSRSCALINDGSVKCWGYNSNGFLGAGDYSQHPTPTPVVGLASGVSSLSTNYANHTCVTLSGGSVKCWGYNNYGQIGDGSTTSRQTPVTVA